MVCCFGCGLELVSSGVWGFFWIVISVFVVGVSVFDWVGCVSCYGWIWWFGCFCFCWGRCYGYCLVCCVLDVWLFGLGCVLVCLLFVLVCVCVVFVCELFGWFVLCCWICGRWLGLVGWRWWWWLVVWVGWSFVVVLWLVFEEIDEVCCGVFFDVVMFVVKGFCCDLDDYLLYILFGGVVDLGVLFLVVFGEF